MKLKLLSQFLQETEEKINCVIGPQLLPTGGVMTIVGGPGVGKSFIAQQTAFEIATGRRWLNLFPVNRKRVAYIELEKRSAIARGRFRQEHWHKEYPEAKDWISYCDDRLLILSTPSDSLTMEKAIQEVEAEVIIIDSFAQTVWDETDISALKQAITNIRTIAKRNHASFILIHQLIKKGVDFDRKAGIYKEAPLRLEDMKGCRHLAYEVDLTIGILAHTKGIREIAFLKSSHAPVEITAVEPIKLDWMPSTAVPFQLPDEIATMIELIDSGVREIRELQEKTKVSRPTILSKLNRLKELGIINVCHTEGKVPSFIEVIKG